MRIGNKFLKNKSYLYNLIYSYCAIIVVLFIIYFVTYSVMSNAFEKEHRRSTERVLESARDSVDSQMLMVSQLANMIATNDEMVEKLSNGGTNGFIFDDYKCEEFLKEINTTSNVVREIYVYNKNRDKIISSTTTATSMDYFDVRHRTDNYKYNDWINMLCGDYSRKITMIPKNSMFDNSATGDSYLAYMLSLPINVNEEKKVTLVMLIDQHKLLEKVDAGAVYGNGQFTVVDKNGDIIISIGNVVNSSKLKDIENGRVKNGREKYSVSTIKSNITSWKYVVITPEKAYMGEVKKVRSVSLVCMLIYIIVGAILIYIFSRRNYEPVEGLFKSLNFNNKGKNNENEFSTISRNIKEIQYEKNKLERDSKKSFDQRRERYFRAILEKSGDPKELFDEAEMKKFGFDIVEEYLHVILVKIENSDSFIHEMNMRLDMAQYAISNVISELFEKVGAKCYLSPISGDTLAAIVNYGDDEYNDMDSVRYVLNNLISFFKENYDMELFSAVSGEADSIYELEQCFEEAKQALEYRIVTEDKKIVFYSEIKERRTDYIFSSDSKRDIQASLNSGNYEKAKEIIDELFAQNVYSGEYTIIAIKSFIFELERTLINQMPTNLVINSTEFYESRASEIHQKILKCISEYCDVQKDKGQINIGDRVIKYINENYQNPDLSVNILGEKFSLSPSYLSKLFREQTGEGLLSYIHEVRIKHAEELLMNGTNIEKTSEKVGYVSSGSFTRAFKKLRGTTPGQFKREKTTE